MLVKIISFTDFIPLPFLFWALKDFLGILLISPDWVTITTTSSGITFIISLSSFEIFICVNSVFLLEPYFFVKDSNLSIKIFKILSLLERISLQSSIVFSNSFFSFSNSIFSKFAIFPNFISTIAFACASENLYLFIKFSFASTALFDALISLIILSISSNAFNKPLTISFLASAFFKS